MVEDNKSRNLVAASHWFTQRFVSLITPAIRPHLPLLAQGICLQILLLVLYLAASELNWYPSRLGAPAEWLDLHFHIPARPYITMGPPGVLPIVIYFGALALIFAVYISAIRYAWRRGAGTRASLYIVLGLSAVSMMSLLLQPHVSSQDIFSYAYYAHIFSLYGGNPYLAVPRDFPFDPLFGAIFWKDQPSNYGPVWTYTSGLITVLAGTHTALTLLGLKTVVTAFALGGVPLVWRILGRSNPRIRLAGTLLYAWNPLLILEVAGSGHNDSIVGFFILLSLFLYSRNAKSAGLAALVLSVLTKYVSAVLLPLYLLLWLRQCANTRDRLATLGKAAVLSLGIAVISYLPIYAGPATFQIASFGTSPSNYINSPLELVFREIRVLLGDSREVASLPLRHRAWWVTTRGSIALWSRADSSDSSAIVLPDSTPLMVVAPQRGPWLYVYAPRLDQFGYVTEAATTRIPTPNFAGAASTANALAQASSHGANLQRANTILRTGSAAVFLLFLLLLGRKTRTLGDLLHSAAATMLASYWLLQTWFWPWYLIWALPLAALVPQTRVAALLVAFSLTTLGLHAQIDVALLPYIDAAYEYRSLAIFGLPVLLVAGWLAFTRLRQPGVTPPFAEPRRRAPIVVGSVVAAIVLLVAGGVILAVSTQNTAGRGEGREPKLTDNSLDWVEHYTAGVEFFGKNQYPEAVDSLTHAIKKQPDYIHSYRIRFLAFLYLGKYDEAIEDISLILSAEGEDLDLLLARGSAYQRTQRSGLALRDFARAISIAPSDSRAYRYQAQAYHELGMMNDAIASQRRAIELSPYSAVLYRELAGMHATLGRFEEALSLYNAAIWLDRYDVESYIGRTSILRILGRAEETIPDLLEVLVLSNDEDVRTWARRTMAVVSGSGTGRQDNDFRPGP